MRTSPEHVAVTTSYSVRFHSVAEAKRAAPYDVVEAHLARAFATTRWAAGGASGDALAGALDDVPKDVEALIARARGEVRSPSDEKWWTPWFDAYRAELDDRLAFHDHEAIDVPAGVVFAVSASSSDPLGDATRMTEDGSSWPGGLPNQPLLERAGDVDVFARHYVLVHDARDATATREAVAAKERILADAFGDAKVSVLPVNSSSSFSSSPHDDDIWTAHLERRMITAANASGAITIDETVKRGALLSKEDVAAHARVVKEYVAGSLLKSMEKRSRAANEKIAATRKGLKNQLKSFWGRSTGASVKTEGDGAYTPASQESQIRVAADLAFFLGDYETAASHYRLIQSDYKADKAWKRLAATQEALGHALVMCKPQQWAAEGPPFRESRREAAAAFEAAAACYARANVHAAGGGQTVAPPGTPPPGGGGGGGGGGGVPGGTGTPGPAFAPPTPTPGGVAAVAAVVAPPAGAFDSVAERTLWATRAAYAHAALLTACGSDREAAIPLTRASAEEAQTHARAALSLEAAATAYLRADPPMARKYAIHAVLAGHRYNQAGLRANAIRCYAGALPVYERRRDAGPGAGKRRGVGWNKAREHLHFALGRQVAHAGDFARARAYFRALLECATTQTAATQATYLREYLYVVQQSYGGQSGAGASAIEETPLPSVDVGDARVTFHDGHVYASDSSFAAKDSISSDTWKVLENDDGLVPAGLQGGGATWLDKPREKGAEQRGVCAAGEAVVVAITLRNPLKVPLDVSDLRLTCEFKGADDADVADAGAVATPSSSATLAPLETATIDARCSPSKPGMLKIVGATWTTCGVAKCAMTFDVRAPRTRATGGAHGGWARDVPRHKRLAFTVAATTPTLDAFLYGAPAATREGATIRVALRIRNVSSCIAHRVRVRLPGRGVLLPVDAADVVGEVVAKGDGGDGDGDAADAFSSGAKPRKAGGPAPPPPPTPSTRPGKVFAPPGWATLAPGAEVTMPLWFHASAAAARASSDGAIALPIVVCYEPPWPAPPLLKFRTTRLLAGIRVAPSLSVAASALPAASHPAARVLRLVTAAAANGVGDDTTKTAASYALRSVSLVDRRGEPRRGVRVTAMGGAAAARVVAPGQRWDTILLVEPTADDGSSSSSSSVAFGGGGEGGAESAPVERVHAAIGAGGGRRRGGGGGGGVLADADVVVRWDEISPAPNAVATSGSHHLYATADGGGWDASAPTKERPRRSRVARGGDDAAAGAFDVTWTLEGPSVATLPPRESSSSSPSSSATVPIVLRAHNPAPYAVDLTFEASAPAAASAWGPIDGAGVGGWTTGAPATPPPPPTPAAAPPSASIFPGRAWMWTGAVRRTVAVAPGETTEMRLSVDVFEPGTFALGEYAVSWGRAEASGDADAAANANRNNVLGGGVTAAAKVMKRTGGPAMACNAPFILSVAAAAA